MPVLRSAALDLFIVQASSIPAQEMFGTIDQDWLSTPILVEAVQMVKYSLWESEAAGQNRTSFTKFWTRRLSFKPDAFATCPDASSFLTATDPQVQHGLLETLMAQNS
jgi:hypothetical protein